VVSHISSLEQLRLMIDELDEIIVLSLAERLRLVRDVGLQKTAEPYDPHREAAILSRVEQLALGNGADAEALKSIYRHIFRVAVEIERVAQTTRHSDERAGSSGSEESRRTEDLI
jgi:chorismate mutase